METYNHTADINQGDFIAIGFAKTFGQVVHAEHSIDACVVTLQEHPEQRAASFRNFYLQDGQFEFER